jgi:hypothetical protein
MLKLKYKFLICDTVPSLLRDSYDSPKSSSRISIGVEVLCAQARIVFGSHSSLECCEFCYCAFHDVNRMNHHTIFAAMIVLG